MAVDPALLQLLVCPKCHKPLALVHDDTGLKCPSVIACIRSRTTFP